MTMNLRRLGYGVATILLKAKHEEVIVWRKDEYMLFTLTSKRVVLIALAGQNILFIVFNFLVSFQYEKGEK